MAITDATSIGIPRIKEEILTEENKDLVRSTNEIAANLKPQTAVLLSHDNDAQRFLLDYDCASIGRDKEANVFLDDHSVSRRHAEVTRIGDVFSISDVGSLNGTYVNNVLQDGRTSLKNGDEIQIGKYKLGFIQTR